MEKQIAVVGGGAAGLAAAVCAARYASMHHINAQVVVYEAADRVGKPILATGNGRCNFSNAVIDPLLYRSAPFVESALNCATAAASEEGLSSGKGRFAGLYAESVRGLFRELGLIWREEGEGRMYPITGKATTVVDVLRSALRVLGVQELCDASVSLVVPPEQPGQKYHLHTRDGRVFHADAVVWATGHRSSLDALPDSLPGEPFSPVLGPLQTETKAVRALDNIRVKAGVWLVAGDDLPRRMADPAAKDLQASVRASWYRWAEESGLAYSSDRPALWMDRPIAAREEGELLFRKYGVSGVCVFNLSRFACPGDVLLIDFVPGVRQCDMEGHLYSRRKQLAGSNLAPKSGLTCEDMMRGWYLPLVGEAILKAAGLRPQDPFTKSDVPALAQAMKRFPLTVTGMGEERQCQVHRGGLAVEAWDARTMESRDYPGLFAAGEALDVDAPCGGYNLHWAWASGMLAGISAAKSV